MCIQCDIMYFRIGSQDCVTCPANSDTSTSASSLCLCKAGYTGTAGACLACARGSYKSILGSASCSMCRPGSYSNGDATVRCIDCPQDTYAPASGNDKALDCVECPHDSHSPAASIFESECTCQQGVVSFLRLFLFFCLCHCSPRSNIISFEML